MSVAIPVFPLLFLLVKPDDWFPPSHNVPLISFFSLCIFGRDLKSSCIFFGVPANSWLSGLFLQKRPDSLNSVKKEVRVKIRCFFLFKGDPLFKRDLRIRMRPDNASSGLKRDLIMYQNIWSPLMYQKGPYNVSNATMNQKGTNNVSKCNQKTPCNSKKTSHCVSLSNDYPNESQMHACDSFGYTAYHFQSVTTLHTGWRRLIGRLKLQVNFRKRATSWRALLRKMTYEDKAPYASTPPCSTFNQSVTTLHITFYHEPFHMTFKYEPHCISLCISQTLTKWIADACPRFIWLHFTALSISNHIAQHFLSLTISHDFQLLTA